MFLRIFFPLFLLASFISFVPNAQAEAQNINTMLARMQVIISQMQTLQAELNTLATQISTASGAPMVLGAQTTNVFTESLQYGETNNDIKKIQRLLATDPVIYPYGVASGFFGPKTKEAIKNLQTRFGLKPVGVIGPATTDLLSSYILAYPDEKYPEGVLSTRPVVPNTVKPVATVSSTPVIPVVKDTNENKVTAIDVEFDHGETWATINFKDKTKKRLVTDSEDETEIVKFIATKLNLSEKEVNDVIKFHGYSKRKNKSKSDYSETEADDALSEARDTLYITRSKINDADDDNKDITWADKTVEEARNVMRDAVTAFSNKRDYSLTVELVTQVKDLADKALNRIDKQE